MTGSTDSYPVTRRLFLEKSVKGTIALAISQLEIFNPRSTFGADTALRLLKIPSPQFPAWTPDGSLLVTFIEEDGSYGLLHADPSLKNPEALRSVGAETGQFNWPQGIAADRSTAYIVDSNNGRIQRLNLGTRGFLEPFGRLGKKSGRFLRPRGICAFEDELFIADTRNHRIQVFSKNGSVKRVFGELGDADDQFRLPTSCAVSLQGEVFVVDSKHALVKVFDSQGNFLRKFGGFSSYRKEPGLLNMPTGISLDSKRNLVLIADTGNSRIQIFEAKGKFLQLVEIPGMALKAPQGIAWLESGVLAIADQDSDSLWVTTL
jgi:DNA-binding beta-propeller fold protein YncE